MQLYEPGASVTPEPGTVVTGTDAVREALSEFLALKPTITFHDRPAISRNGNRDLILTQYLKVGRLTGQKSSC